MDKEKNKKVSKGILSGCLGCFGLIVILGIVIGACSAITNKNDTKEQTVTIEKDNVESDKNTDNTSQKTEPKKENRTTPGGDWKAKIKEVSKMDGKESDKFNEIDQYAYDYKPSNKEVSEFVTYILAQYESKKYLKDISNDKYMLENIFKSSVVDNYYKKEKNNPYGDFAFDFYQNSKYVYRGVDTIGSTAVTSNERQMDKALHRINNKE